MRFRRICRVPVETTGSTGTQAEPEMYQYSEYTYVNSSIFYSSYPFGLFDCHLQESSHISLIPNSAFQPSSFSAFSALA